MDLRAFGINQFVNYEEVVYDNQIINKIYLVSNPNNILIKAIPDGCVDLQIVGYQGKTKVYLSGSHMLGTDAYIMKYDRVFGVKFQPGTEISVLRKKKVALEELVGNRYEITDMFERDYLVHSFRKQAGFQELLDCFKKSAFSLIFGERDYMISYLLKEVEKEKGNLNITELIEKTGYSQRYVNRVCRDKMGFSLKKYAGIIRMQYALDVMRENPEGELYHLLGYYDRAHFVHDFKNFTLITPKKYQELKENFYYV